MRRVVDRPGQSRPRRAGIAPPASGVALRLALVDGAVDPDGTRGAVSRILELGPDAVVLGAEERRRAAARAAGSVVVVVAHLDIADDPGRGHARASPRGRPRDRGAAPARGQRRCSVAQSRSPSLTSVSIASRRSGGKESLASPGAKRCRGGGSAGRPARLVLAARQRREHRNYRAAALNTLTRRVRAFLSARGPRRAAEKTEGTLRSATRSCSSGLPHPGLPSTSSTPP